MPAGNDFDSGRFELFDFGHPGGRVGGVFVINADLCALPARRERARDARPAHANHRDLRASESAHGKPPSMR